MKTLIGYEIMLDCGDGSVRAKKFKTYESAAAYLQAEEDQGYSIPCEAGPRPVYLEDYEDEEYGN